MAEQDNSTRNIAGVAAVVAILALVVGLVESSRSGMIAQYTGITKVVAEQNDIALLQRIDNLTARVDGLEKELREAKAADEAEAPAAADAAPAGH